VSVEHDRLNDAGSGAASWRRWGPYVSTRQWGTVREDYSADGSAWDYFPHDHARSRAYRWGEDGIGGVCDDQQHLTLTLALHNGSDHIIKERFFGLANSEGNHGEDVKELWWYLDATPTGSWARMLYKYPQSAFPYQQLVEENAKRSQQDPEFELVDTGILDDDRYWDVFIEQAKGDPEDILYRVEVFNRGPEDAELDVLPQLTFRNTWAWTEGAERPTITAGDGSGRLVLEHPELGTMHAAFEGEASILWCDNDTNTVRLDGGKRDGRVFKDGINDFVVDGDAEAVRTDGPGTRVAGRHHLRVASGASAVVRVRLSRTRHDDPFGKFDAVLAERKSEADGFYASLQDAVEDEDMRLIQRQAWAGMVWCKQYYGYDVARWLDGDPAQPTPPASRLHGRNCHWRNLDNGDIISMPDDWEYPWYALWDLAFHSVVFASIDPDFAKRQLVLLTQDRFMHPNGALPAYEWSFDDVNPPVHAWAAWRVYKIDAARTGKPDLEFLERVFHRLLMNFTWWVNRKDASGRNIFEGGFLGLDNIGVFDRSSKLPGDGTLEQADGTSWMAMFSLTMMRIAIELGTVKPVYQDLATKFLEHFLRIAAAMTDIRGTGDGLWDEEDEFYYDLLELPDGTRQRMRIHSIVGLIPLFAVEVLEPETLAKVPAFAERLEWYFEKRPELATLVSRWTEPGRGERRLFSLLRGHRMKCLFTKMLDETRFLSDYGIRSVSKLHEREPYVLEIDGASYRIDYEPGESNSNLFGGNSNWRGPIWFPINFLIIEAMQRFHHYYGDDFRIEYPVGSGETVTIREASKEVATRLIDIFRADENGRRPVHGACEKLQSDPHFKDLVLFHEYFHGETGRGCGASHQTGWTGLIAKIIERYFGGPPPHGSELGLTGAPTSPDEDSGSGDSKT
jgi:hypothetical protein